METTTADKEAKRPGKPLAAHALKIARLDEDAAAITFVVCDREQVAAFLRDMPRIRFLTDDVATGDSRGCRLRIAAEGGRLTFGRKAGPRTIMRAAYLDLVRTVLSFVWAAPLEAEADLWRGHVPVGLTLWERAAKFA